MIKSEQVKEMLLSRGADLCGIASVDRFSDAPEGYHPRDVLPDCRSVIVFAHRFLSGTIRCGSTVPYTIVRNVLSQEMDRIALEFCMDLEKRNITTIPTGTIGPTEMDTRTRRFRNIVSAKHCAQAAGLGVIGKNSLLITPQFGNMVWLSVILTEADLEPDPMIHSKLCPDSCRLCMDACPIHAISAEGVNQMDCWNYAFGAEDGGDFKIKCNRCRTICPHCLGDINGSRG